ncbi:hypothetical protein D3C87_1094880 [compost metagenome]
MPAHKLGEGPLKGDHIEIAVHPHRRGDVIGRTERLKLFQNPEPVLRERQRDLTIPRNRHKARGRYSSLLPLDNLDTVSKFNHPWILEEGAQWQFDVEDAADPGDHAHGQQGVSSEFEEVVIDTDLADLEDVGPDGGEDLFGGRARGDVVGARQAIIVVGMRESSTIDLAVRGQRHRLERDEGGRHHVVGQGVESVSTQVPWARLADDIGEETLVTGLVLMGDDDGLANFWMGQQHGLDLAELDAEAADLDLVVGAAEELQIAVLAPAPEITGAVEPVP